MFQRLFSVVVVVFLTSCSSQPQMVSRKPLKVEFAFWWGDFTLLVAKEKGFFEDEGLYVTLEAQANWKVLLDGVIGGQIDGAHMLAGQPIGSTIGFGTQADVVTPLSMDLNGNGITVSNDVWSKMKPVIPMKDGKTVHTIKADALKPAIED